MRVMLGLAFMVSAASCAERQVPAPTGQANQPRVGWVVMFGDTENPDREFACQSNPRSACVLPASRTSEKTAAALHLYFFPGQSETRFSGAMAPGFFGGDSSPRSLPPVQVKRGDVGNFSVVGLVTDQPGPRTLSINLRAQVGSGPDHEIEERVEFSVN